MSSQIHVNDVKSKIKTVIDNTDSEIYTFHLLEKRRLSHE